MQINPHKLVKFLLVTWLLLPGLAYAQASSFFGAWVISDVNATTTNLSVGNIGVLERFTASDIWTGGDPSNNANYTWTDLDTICTNAQTGVGNTKNSSAAFKIILDIELGVNISDGERTRLSSNSPTSLTSNLWSFNRVITQSGSAIVPCDSIQSPIWYDTHYLADVDTFYKKLAARVTTDSCTSSVVGIVNTVVTYNDDEYSAFNNRLNQTLTCTGGGDGATAPSNAQCTSACGGNTCTCTVGTADTTNLLNLATPYTGKLIADASATVDSSIATAFPNKVIEHMFLGGVTGTTDRFPPINYLTATLVNGQTGSFPVPNEVTQIVTDAQQTNPNLWPLWEYQSNNLANTGTHLETVSRLTSLNSFIGFQSAGGGVLTSEANFAGAVGQGINIGACHMEFYAGEPPNDALGTWTNTELLNCLSHNHQLKN